MYVSCLTDTICNILFSIWKAPYVWTPIEKKTISIKNLNWPKITQLKDSCHKTLRYFFKNGIKPEMGLNPITSVKIIHLFLFYKELKLGGNLFES